MLRAHRDLVAAPLAAFEETADIFFAAASSAFLPSMAVNISFCSVEALRAFLAGFATFRRGLLVNAAAQRLHEGTRLSERT